MEVENGVEMGLKSLEEHQPQREQEQEAGQALAETLETEAVTMLGAEYLNGALKEQDKGSEESAFGLTQVRQLETEYDESRNRRGSGPDGVEPSTKKHKRHGTDFDLEAVLVVEPTMAETSEKESISEPGSGNVSNAEAIEQQQALGESCTEASALAAPPSTRPELEEGLQGPKQSQPSPLAQAAPAERPPLTMADVQGLLSDYRSLKPRQKQESRQKKEPRQRKEPPPPVVSNAPHPVTTVPQPVMNYWPNGPPLPYLPFQPLQPLPPPFPKLKHQPPQLIPAPAPFDGYFGPPGQAGPSQHPPPLGYFPVHPPMPASHPPPKLQEGSQPAAVANHRIVKMLTCKCKRLVNEGTERPQGVEGSDGVNEADKPSEPTCTCDIHRLCKDIGPLPIREDVAEALAGFKHDGSVRGRKEEAIRHFLSQIIPQVLNHNVLLLRNLTALATAANANAGCGTEKGASMSARPEGVYNLVCNCLQLKPATASERALGTILLPTHCISASPFIFKLMKELQQSKRSKSKK